MSEKTTKPDLIIDKAYILANRLKVLASKGVLSSAWNETLDQAAEELESFGMARMARHGKSDD